VPGLRRTPLYEVHKRLSARMVEFAGFEMPVHYSSIVKEHTAVREAAGLFDVSHMGQIQLDGPGAVAAAEKLLSRPVASLAVGRIRYGLLCNEEGGVVDDVTFYRMAEDSVFLCVNAANVEKDWRWIVRHAGADATPRNLSEQTGMLALQGPASAAVLDRVGGRAAGELRRYAFTHLELNGAPTIVSRTGYTGSDGFEIYVGAGHLVRIFEALLDAGKPLGLVPAGLGARDTLRIEGAMPLYGHELDDETSPLEAGLGNFVKLDAGGFIGVEAIRRRAAAGPKRVLVGFELEDRGVARAEYPVLSNTETIGIVTSGAPSPTLGKSIGLAYVSPGHEAVGTRIDISIRGRATAARIVDTPFVKTARPGA
jgi:aminomethyltransferase